MPTHDPDLALDLDVVRSVVARALEDSPADGDQVGLEVEWLPVRHDLPTRRVALAGGQPPTVGDVLSRHGDLAPSDRLPAGSVITTEPGGQVEVSTTCHQTVDAAVAEADDAATLLADWFGREGIALVAAGVDVWHELVPQQLREPRYPAMASYFASRGPAGATMMRHTCALQVSLDVGPTPTDVEERWMAANLLAPLTTATFANSPTPDGAIRSQRSRTWQRVDPTRTGFPTLLLEGHGGMVEQVTRAAVEADVLLVRTGVDAEGRVTAAVPGTPGWSFGDWLRAGHPVHGRPTRDDLAYHLTTLFHEVRARGPIEIRGIDALPRAWRAVPVALFAGALFDRAARSRILEILEPRRRDLPRLLRQAAVTGVSDPSMCALAVEVWSFALDGARRLDGVGPTHLRACEAYLDRYTLRGRCPADELAARLRIDPREAMAWASEPVPAPMRG